MRPPNRESRDVQSFEGYLRVMRPRLWAAVVLQAVRLPWTLMTVYRLVEEDCRAEALDRNVQTFCAYQQGLPDAHHYARRWDKARLGDIDGRDVAGLPVWEMALMMGVAMEIEDPVLDYSRQNAEGFRTLMPALARFMGSSHDPQRLAPWCDSPWCSEERRHANAFAGMIHRLTGTWPARENPNRPRSAGPHRADAVRLLTSRESAEWNSSSTYLVMAAHATAPLHTLIRNIARDEIKHLAILSSIDVHVLGAGRGRRFLRLVKQGLEEYRNHRRKRSAGHLLGVNPVTSFEVIICHLLIEARVRRWLRGAARWFETDAERAVGPSREEGATRPRAPES
jgi:hypothetical protein